MFDATLSDEERQMKLEKMADNEVMKVQEMNRLEQEEKSLYGFDLSNFMQNKDVQDAENAWISPQSISNLVDSFLVDFLGDGEYIRSNKTSEICTMRISADKRARLKENLTKLNLTNANNATKLWNAYLKSNTPQIRLTYDATTAKDNREVIFLTQMHPLVQQAARYESKQFPCVIGVSVSDDSIPAGDYEFLIYAWKYVGLRPDIKLIAVSDNEQVQDNILLFLQYASDYAFDDGTYTTKWEAMDSIHYEKWQMTKAEYIQSVREDCEYRVDQLRQNTTKRESVIRAQIAGANNENILRMRTAQLGNLKKNYEEQKKALEETIGKADIHTQPLVKGILHVE
jgi:hypothetical protein